MREVGGGEGYHELLYPKKMQAWFYIWKSINVFH